MSLIRTYSTTSMTPVAIVCGSPASGADRTGGGRRLPSSSGDWCSSGCPMLLLLLFSGRRYCPNTMIRTRGASTLPVWLALSVLSVIYALNVRRERFAGSARCC
jgi:hypothetical protein